MVGPPFVAAKRFQYASALPVLRDEGNLWTPRRLRPGWVGVGARDSGGKGFGIRANAAYGSSDEGLFPRHCRRRHERARLADGVRRRRRAWVRRRGLSTRQHLSGRPGHSVPSRVRRRPRPRRPRPRHHRLQRGAGPGQQPRTRGAAGERGLLPQFRGVPRALFGGARNLRRRRQLRQVDVDRDAGGDDDGGRPRSGLLHRRRAPRPADHRPCRNRSPVSARGRRIHRQPRGPALEVPALRRQGAADQFARARPLQRLPDNGRLRGAVRGADRAAACRWSTGLRARLRAATAADRRPGGGLVRPRRGRGLLRRRRPDRRNDALQAAHAFRRDLALGDRVARSAQHRKCRRRLLPSCSNGVS